MELFDEKGCLTDEGLRALTEGYLEELDRLEAAEHLAYCDRCMDRYTALLTGDALEQPPHSARGAVMGTIWIRLMENTWGRAAVAAVAAVLALTMWRAGMPGQLKAFRAQVKTFLPAASQSQAESETPQLGCPVQDDDRQPTTPETLGRPAEDSRPESKISLADALNVLLFGSHDHLAETLQK